MVIKICIASVNSSKPMLIESVYSNGTLVMSDPISCPASRDDIIKTFLPRLKNRKQQGFKVMIDEVSGELSRACGCQMVRLADQHTDGRPVLSVALDRYNEMVKTRSIIKPANGSGFDIPRSIIDISSNAKGEQTYNILWEEVKPTHILTVLTVYASMHNSPGSADYIRRLEAAFGREPSLHSSGNWLTDHFSRLDAPPKSLSGMVTDDGDLIL